MTDSGSQSGDDFQCPVCRAGEYEALVLNRPDGSRSTLNFFRCRKCGYAFSDPAAHVKKSMGRSGKAADRKK